MEQTQKKVKIKFPEFYPAQLEIVKECIKGSARYYIVNGSRQVGKTVLLSNIALYWALDMPSQTIMIVSPKDSQVKKIYQEIRQTIDSIFKISVKSAKGSGGQAEIVFINKSRILFRSAKSEDTLRGNSLTHILIDEAAFIKEEVWTKILSHTLAVRGKKVLFCSTPRGDNFFKKLYMKGFGSDKNYKSFNLNYKDNPYANLEFIQEQKESLIKEIFDQEYEGVFTDSFSVFKYIRELAIYKPQQPKGQPCVVGIDIGFKKDYTVALCLSTTGQMLDYIRFNQVDTQEVVKRLYEFIQKWKPKRTIIEENNQGLPIYDLLKVKGISNFQPFNTNGKTKGEIINQLIAAFNSKEIKLLDDQLLISEFEAFTYSLTKSGNIQFEAAYGNDDIPMATALAWKAMVDSRLSQVVWM